MAADGVVCVQQVRETRNVLHVFTGEVTGKNVMVTLKSSQKRSIILKKRVVTLHFMF